MKQAKYLTLLLLFHISIRGFPQQSYTILDRFIQDRELQYWSDFVEPMSEIRKFEKLNSISLSDTLLDYDETLEDYFPLDTSSIYFLDVNFDGKPDLVYVGMVSYTRYSTKIYIQENGIFQLREEYTGFTRHIEIDCYDKKVSLWVHEPPCCDSYTHSLMVYELSDRGQLNLMQRILFLDPNGRNFKGIPEF